jgi:hypothetical protein
VTETGWMQSVCPEGALPGTAVLEREIFVAAPEEEPAPPPIEDDPPLRPWAAAGRAAALVPATLGLLTAAGFVLVLVDANA